MKRFIYSMVAVSGFTIVIFFAFSIPLFALVTVSHVATALRNRGINSFVITGVISMVPVFELRAGIPVGIAFFKQPVVPTYLVSVFANLVPIIPVIYLLLPIRAFLLRHGVFKGFFSFLDRRVERERDIVERYEELGLLLFVMVPLPVTGAWTGSIIAAVLGLRPLKSFVFISLGVMGAGILVTLITLLGMKALVFVIIGIIVVAIIGFFGPLRSRKRGKK